MREVVEEAKALGISVELIDLCTIQPWDEETVCNVGELDFQG